MSRLVSRSSRVSVGVKPIIAESVGSEPGPIPPMMRPWVRWSSSIKRSATQSGLWYASEMTPVPKRILLARSAAAAMKISGELMISLPAEWCSPIPHLVEAECVEMLDEFEVALQRQRRVGARAVKRCDEVSEPQPGHLAPPCARDILDPKPASPEDVII